MTEIFSDGFESGDFSAWTGYSGGTVQTTYVHSGTYAAQYTAYGYAYKDVANQNIIHIRTYIRYGALPDAGSKRILLLRDVATEHLQVQYELSGTQHQFVLFATGDNVELGTYAVELNTGQWYCVEAAFDAVNDTAKLWLDGSLVINATHDWGTKVVNRGFIITDSYTNTDVCFDDVIFADTYIGPIAAGGQPYISRVQRITGMRTWGGISSICKRNLRFPKLMPKTF